jgi:hypothetical protein
VRVSQPVNLDGSEVEQACLHLSPPRFTDLRYRAR